MTKQHDSRPDKTKRPEWVIVARDAIIVGAMASIIGLVVNLFHPEAIPYIAEEEYEILVPCPEPGGEVTAVSPGDEVIGRDDTFVIDARLENEFKAWHFKNAVNVPYDYLDPTPKSVLQDLARGIASSRSKQVLVYGDGDTPDTGEQLGKEISGHGIKNVMYLKGGAPALNPSGGEK